MGILLLVILGLWVLGNGLMALLQLLNPNERKMIEFMGSIYVILTIVGLAVSLFVHSMSTVAYTGFIIANVLILGVMVIFPGIKKVFKNSEYVFGEDTFIKVFFGFRGFFTLLYIAFIVLGGFMLANNMKLL